LLEEENIRPEQTDAKNKTITFIYDQVNRVTKKDYPTGTDINYYYDEGTSRGSGTARAKTRVRSLSLHFPITPAKLSAWRDHCV